MSTATTTRTMKTVTLIPDTTQAVVADPKTEVIAIVNFISISSTFVVPREETV